MAPCQAAPTRDQEPPGIVGDALVAFSLHTAFPDESTSALEVRQAHLEPAIDALSDAKSKLKAEIHTINQETADDLRSWVANAKSLQDDMFRSKSQARDILAQSEAPQVTGEAIAEAEDKVHFLARELSYNEQLRHALLGIKEVNSLLDQVEQARNERRILDALHLLERSWRGMDAISASKSCRAMKLLDIRAFELKSDVHDVFDHVWDALVRVEADRGRISISHQLDDESMSLADAVIGLKAYKEVDQRMALLWHDVDNVVIRPRMDLEAASLPSFKMQDPATLEVHGEADRSIRSLFADLEQVFGYFAKTLPPDLVHSLSVVMMPDLMARITGGWLNAAVPSSLREMEQFQQVIGAARGFCDTLKSLGFSGFDELCEWVDSAPRVWLAKCRETALDTVRCRLAQGLGSTKEVERVEKQMVSRSEGKEMAANGSLSARGAQSWDAAWFDGEDEPETNSQRAGDGPDMPVTAEDDGADAWGWGDDDGDAPVEEQPEHMAQAEQTATDSTAQEAGGDEEDDPTEAWGWGDEDTTEGDAPQPPEKQLSGKPNPTTHEMTLKETYNISSLPEPVLALIFALLDDGATLTQDSEPSPVASEAAGLFSLPTLALAMFRAVGPYYYTRAAGGSMYLYNDATYLAERLVDFAAAWKIRENISPRAKAMLRLDNDIRTLKSFATRTYSDEMSVQKTIIKDLLGGAGNLLHQDDQESSVESAVAHVRSIASTWDRILARSVWYQAAGSLVDTVSTKIITDVMDLPSIGQDEAYKTASLIARVEELDDLFLPSKFQSHPVSEAEDIPTTAQWAASWLRLKYLSEVLQSNLNDVRYLWCESELSLYFTLDEVVDLINLSFEDNPRTREVIREIKQKPKPTGETMTAW